MLRWIFACLGFGSASATASVDSLNASLSLAKTRVAELSESTAQLEAKVADASAHNAGLEKRASEREAYKAREGYMGGRPWMRLSEGSSDCCFLPLVSDG